jgi:hypothetical protein
MIEMSLDTTEFDKVFAEYMTFQKRLPADVVNAKLYYIARNATMTTKRASKDDIATKLHGKADKYNAPLGALIVNKQLKAKGEKGITGSRMARELEKLIKRRQRAINFVRAGWKNAIVILENYLRQKGELNFVKRWASSAPADKQTLRFKNFERLGKAHPALVERQSGRVYGEIQNDIGGKTPNAYLTQIKETGLQAAVNKEIASMRIYIERKLNPVHREFNRKQGL